MGINTTPYTVIYDDDAISVLCYRESLKPTLIVGPQAGHRTRKLIDWGVEGCSLVQTVLDNTTGGVYAIDWKPCTYKRRNESYMDLILQLQWAIRSIGPEPVRLVGLCQGGTLSAVYAALYPKEVTHLDLAGAPINTHVGKSELQYAIDQNIWWLDSILNLYGYMPGWTKVATWKSSKVWDHYFERYRNPTPESDVFYDWYDEGAGVAKVWLRHLYQSFFKDNDLYHGRFVVGDRVVDLRKITCPVNLIAGERDTITPPEQIFALCDLVPHAKKRIVKEAGHIKIFTGKNQEVWKECLRDTRRNSHFFVMF